MSPKFLLFVVVGFILVTQGSSFILGDILRKMINEGLDNLFYVRRDANGLGNIGGFIKVVLERLRGNLRTGNPKLGLPVVDPFKVPPIKQSFNQYSVDVEFNIPNLILYGLSSYQIRNLDINLDNRTIFLEINMPLLNGTGNFTYSGTAAFFFSISGGGVLSIELRNFFISLFVSLYVTPEETIQIDKLTLDTTIGSINIDIPSIFGGGSWTSILQTILSTAGPLLFNGLRSQFVGKLSDTIRNKTNEALLNIPKGLLLPESLANRFVDRMLTRVVASPDFKNLEHLTLPNYDLGVPFVASASMYDGRMVGISSLKRTGDVVIGGRNDTIFVAGAFGIRDLKFRYSGSARVTFFSKDLRVDGSISRCSIAFLVSMSAQEGAHPQLEEFRIVELSPVIIHFTTNLVLLPFFLNLASTGLSVLVTPILQFALTSTIRKVIATQLQNVTLPI